MQNNRLFIKTLYKNSIDHYDFFPKKSFIIIYAFLFVINLIIVIDFILPSYSQNALTHIDIKQHTY